MIVAGVGLLTGWGRGIEALPGDAAAAAGDRYVIALPQPAVPGERLFQRGAARRQDEG